MRYVDFILAMRADFVWEDFDKNNPRHYDSINRRLIAGTFLKIEKHSEIQLVGDVNEQFGVCDDCTMFELGDIQQIGLIL